MYINISHIGCNYHQKMMTHYSVMTSSLRIKIFKNDLFSDFRAMSIILNSRTDLFRDVISLIINPHTPKGRLQRTQSGRQSRSAIKRSALVTYNSKSIDSNYLK